MRVHRFIINANIQRSDLTAISAKSSRFISDIRMEYTNEDGLECFVDVKSLLGMLLLPIKTGTAIRLVTKGKDEEEAMDYIYKLFEAYV
jgi:phosphocarrier protein